MAKARAIVKRRKAVQNIRKITRTMQLIATARYQAAMNRAVRSRPYTEHITKLVEQLSRGKGTIDHPLLQENTESKKAVMIVITSNRGLCGGYNASLLREAVDQYQQLDAAGIERELHAMGKKGIAFFDFRKYTMAERETRFEDKPQFAEVEPIAQDLMDRYERGEIDAVYVTYMKFISVGVQRPETMKLLPIERPGATTDDPAAQADLAEQSSGSGELMYDFSPPAEELLQELLPETVKIRLFQCFIDAAVSEQVARMVAMKAATDAAGDMIKRLTNMYNRARQTQITLELLDIVSGAESLK